MICRDVRQGRRRSRAKALMRAHSRTKAVADATALRNRKGGMRKRRRTTITVESSEVLVIRKPGGSILAWCPGCVAETVMIRPEAAAVLTGLSTRTIYRRVEAGRVHFAETTEGALLVCLNSLLANRE